MLLTDEDVAVGRENIHERIQVVWVGPRQPVEIHDSVSTRRLGQDLQTGLWSSVGTMFATDDQDRTIGQDQSGRVPSPTLEGNGLYIFLPVVGPINTVGTIWGVETDAVKRVDTPSADIDLSPGLVR